MRIWKWAQALCAVVAVVSLVWVGLGRPGYSAAPAPIASFAVKIDFPEGHGSGSHIGHGYILTAAHVVEGRVPKVLTDTGVEKDVAVLWINKDYDVALLRIADYDDVASIPLSCSELPVGTRYVAYGNPGAVEFVSSAGTVVGKAEARGPWRSVVTINGTLVMGMSGGGVVSNGRVVGVSVGVQSVQLGFSSSITGFGFVVPGSVVCELLAR